MGDFGIMKKYFWYIFGIVVGLASVTSLVLYLFFPQLNIPRREPRFFVDEARSIIIREADMQDAPFKVVKRDSIPVSSSVVAVRFFFWNQGKMEIMDSDMLTPVRVIVNDPTAEIIRVDTLRVTRPVTELGVRRSSTADSLRALDLYFRVLEHEDGGAFQIIYEGDPWADVGIHGEIKGRIDLSNTDRRESSFLDFIDAAMILVTVYFLFLIAFMVFMFRLSILRDRKAWSKMKNSYSREAVYSLRQRLDVWRYRSVMLATLLVLVMITSTVVAFKFRALENHDPLPVPKALLTEAEE